MFFHASHGYMDVKEKAQSPTLIFPFPVFQLCLMFLQHSALATLPEVFQSRRRLELSPTGLYRAGPNALRFTGHSPISVKFELFQ